MTAFGAWHVRRGESWYRKNSRHNVHEKPPFFFVQQHVAGRIVLLILMSVQFNLVSKPQYLYSEDIISFLAWHVYFDDSSCYY